MSKSKTATKRYAAKLLFQFRVGEGGKMRMCEERIVVFQTSSAKRALRQAKRRGRESQSQYRSGEGEKVRIEFVGVMALLHLGIECDEDEVWYEIRDRLMPMERREKLIPKETELDAIFWEHSIKWQEQQIGTRMPRDIRRILLPPDELIKTGAHV